MNWSVVRVLMAHELRMLVRARRTVVLSLLLPLVVMPVVLFGARFMNAQRQENLEGTLYSYAVTGSQADAIRALVGRAQKHMDARTVSQGDEDPFLFDYQELPAARPGMLLKSGELHFYLEALSGSEADSLEAAAADSTEAGSNDDETGSELITDTRYPGVPVLNMYFRANRDDSREGQQKMWMLLREIREADRREALRLAGLYVESGSIMAVEVENVATAGQMSGSLLGRFLPIMLVFLMLTGGSVVAMDCIVGEKERGSLETLLTTSASRVEIVAGKQFTILAVALVITGIQIANLLCYLTFGFIDLPQDLALALAPASVGLIFLLFLPVAALTSSVLLLISAYAKSYKETQFYFFPVFLLVLVLMSAALLPGISLGSAIVLVPLANVSVAVREILTGVHNWPMLFITFAVMSGAAFAGIRLSAGMLSMERLIVMGDSDEPHQTAGRPGFPGHVAAWYAVIWAVMFAVAVNLPVDGAFFYQLIFNELFLFLAVPLVIIWRYRLPIKEALALRSVKPIIWPVILLLIPATQLAGTAVFHLANLVFPVPDKLLEEFGRNILPEEIPLWQLLVYVGVIPGICEEIAFRGTLLYGLRRRFRPVALTLLIGLIFGLYHMELFRIIPTGFLGVVITAVVLMTGSIFPAMLLHAGNNILAVLLASRGIEMGGLDWWHYGLGIVAFAGCFVLIYKNRSVYPGLLRRPER